MRNPILELKILSDEIWNENKAINFSSNPKTEIKRMEKMIQQIKDLHPKLEREMIMLRELKKIKP